MNGVNVRLFMEGFRRKLATGYPMGWCGRILYGQTNHSFKHLSNEPNRRIVTVVGSDGLVRMTGLSGRDMLALVGYTAGQIDDLINASNYFRLLVFQRNPAIRLAAWDEVADLVSQIYPETTKAFAWHINELYSISFNIWLKATEFDWAEV